MTKTTHVLKCKDCMAVLDEDPGIPEDERTPCPECGSLERHCEVFIEDGIKLGDSLKAEGLHWEKILVSWRSIEASDYRRPESWWYGKTVRNRVVIANKYARLAPGTMFTVERKYGGLGLRTHHCITCGIELYINKVDYEQLELMELEEVSDG